MADDKSITGDVRPSAEFEFTCEPRNMAQSTFTALTNGKLIVTRRFTDLCSLPDDTPVLAHWHGERRTDGFSTTIAQLKAKSPDIDEQVAEAKTRAEEAAKMKARKKAEYRAYELAKTTKAKAKIEAKEKAQNEAEAEAKTKTRILAEAEARAQARREAWAKAKGVLS